MLLLLSCNHHPTTEKEGAREVVVKVDAPVSARVERVAIEQTEGTGCGGSPETRTTYRCELVVERGKPAREAAPCTPNGEAKLEVDPKGERFAVADEHRWQLYAGGWDGVLAKADASVPAATSPDWQRVPSAHDIFFRSLDGRLTKDNYRNVDTRTALAALLDDLARVAPERLADDLAALTNGDGIDGCARHGSSWGDFYDRQSDEIKAAVKAKLLAKRILLSSRSAEGGRELGPRMKGPFGHGIEHAIRVLDGKEILAEIGDPEEFLAKRILMSSRSAAGGREFLEAHDKTKDRATASAAAAVLQAWSQAAPKAAAAYACKELPEIGGSPLEDAAFAAIAHAKLNCAATATRTPRWCEDVLRVANLEDEQSDVKPDTVFCEPWEGFMLAKRLTDRKFDAEAFHVLCRKAAAKDAGLDAEPDEDNE